MKDDIDRIAASRTARAGKPEQAKRIASEVRTYRRHLAQGRLTQLSPLAQRVDLLSKLALMGRKVLKRRR